MAVEGELPEKPNRRAGLGWWMDADGTWCPPEEWPEDTPPLDGWIRAENGRWQDAGSVPVSKPTSAQQVSTRSAAVEEESVAPKRRSRQAEADRRAILSVLGALVAAGLLLIAALVVINQADASPDAVDITTSTSQPRVIFQAETEAERRSSAAAQAPTEALEQLLALSIRSGPAETAVFDSQAWMPETDSCLDVAEQALVARSAVDVTFADERECELARGRWTDRYQGTELQIVTDTEVQALVPPQDVHLSGGADWTVDTRQGYLADLDHPATLHVIARSSGHNPRGESPDRWRPSSRATWCAYAIDWVAVKFRWSLSVTPAEHVALSEMLETCNEAGSNGADPGSLATSSVPDPQIATVG